MRQKTCFSVVEMSSENVPFVSENEGSDLGIPWPDGPPSSDCPVRLHADDAPRRHRGSRPVLAQNQGVRVPIPAGAFYAPQNTPQGFFRSQNAVLARKTHAYHTNPNICWDLRVPNPAGAFLCPPKHAPTLFFSAADMLFWGTRPPPPPGNQPLDRHQPIPKQKVRTPKASLVGKNGEIWKPAVCHWLVC